MAFFFFKEDNTHLCTSLSFYIPYEFVKVCTPSFWLSRDTCSWYTRLQARVGVRVHVYAQADSRKIFVCSTPRTSIMLSNQYFPWHRGISFIYCSFSSPFLFLRTWFSLSLVALVVRSPLVFCINFVSWMYINRPHDVYLRGKYSGCS